MSTAKPPQLPPMPGPPRMDPGERTKNFWSKLYKLSGVINRPLRFVAGEGNDILYRFFQVTAAGLVMALLAGVAWIILGPPGPNASSKPSGGVGPSATASQDQARVVLPAKQSSSKPELPDFRNLKWGMSRDAVKRTEAGKPLLDSDVALGYDVRLAGLACYLFCYFAEDQLAQTRYVVSEQHVNLIHYLTDYGTIKAAMIKKYGQPLSDETQWIHDLYKDDPQEWGMAVGMGHLAKTALWCNETAIITLDIRGDNFDVDVTIAYTSVRLSPLLHKIRERATANSL